MNDTFPYIVAIVFALITGYVIGIYISRLKANVVRSKLEKNEENLEDDILELKREIDRVTLEKENLQQTKEQMLMKVAILEADLKNVRENLEQQKTNEEQLQEKFENLANKILEANSSKFTKHNKESIEGLLNPLKDKIKNFEEKVDKTHKESIDYHAALRQQILGLKELNTQMTKEATNLTRALKGDSKAQGNWGELVLENVLEKSNLVKDREYFVQQSFKREDGSRVMPDVIIHLPDNKRMVIDSKVSLTAYEKYTRAENEDEKKILLRDHIRSIKLHIEQLNQKKYEDLYQTETPDFVLMFVPIEPALYLAQNEDNDFFYTAFNKNILLVSPTTLLSVLRTIDTLWKNEKQQQNAFEIAQHASSLYAKFKNLLDDLETVGNRIKSTGMAYESAMKKLTGKQNLIKDIDKLEKLGISPKSKIGSKWLKRSKEERGDFEQEKPKLEL
jgi:DNA recombination protein RmuC